MLADLLNKGTKLVNKGIHTGKELFNKAKNPSTAYPPNLTSIKNEYGGEDITSLQIGRTPVPSLITGAMNAVSFGGFEKVMRKAPYDKLFHLFAIVQTNKGKFLLEKNERVNVSKSIPSKGLETMPVPISHLTVNDLIDNTQHKMGGNFLPYDPYHSNCQDFIMNLLEANHLMTSQLRDFVKQDTDKIFMENPLLAKISKGLTDVGASVNVLQQGGSLRKRKSHHSNMEEQMHQVHIHASPRSLARLMKEGACRVSKPVEGKGMGIEVLPRTYHLITKSFSQGKGLNLKLSEHEHKHNHGKGIFGKTGDDILRKMGGDNFKDSAYRMGDMVKPMFKQAVKKGIETGGMALASYAPMLAPAIALGAPMLEDYANNYLDNPSAFGVGQRGGNEPPSRFNPRNALTQIGMSQYDKYAGDYGMPSSQQLSNLHSDPYAVAEQEYGVPNMSALNAYTGQNMGNLAAASLGKYASNMGRSEMERHSQVSRARVPIPHSTEQKRRKKQKRRGGQGHGLYGDNSGRGLYGGGLYGGGLGGSLHHRKHKPRREVGSLGVGGNLLGDYEPPALKSQPMSANFQFGSRLGAPIQRLSWSGL